MLRCPGKDQRFWKPDDIFEVRCLGCGQTTEFFRDEPKVKCRKCGRTVLNPKINLDCAQWCRYAEHCPGVSFEKNPNYQKPSYRKRRKHD